MLQNLFGNSEETKLLICTVIFVWCLLRQRNGGFSPGLKPATIVTDAFDTKMNIYVNQVFKKRKNAIEQIFSQITFDMVAFLFPYNYHFCLQGSREGNKKNRKVS